MYDWTQMKKLTFTVKMMLRRYLYLSKTQYNVNKQQQWQNMRRRGSEVSKKLKPILYTLQLGRAAFSQL